MLSDGSVTTLAGGGDRGKWDADGTAATFGDELRAVLVLLTQRHAYVADYDCGNIRRLLLDPPYTVDTVVNAASASAVASAVRSYGSWFKGCARTVRTTCCLLALTVLSCT